MMLNFYFYEKHVTIVVARDSSEQELEQVKFNRHPMHDEKLTADHGWTGETWVADIHNKYANNKI